MIDHNAIDAKLISQSNHVLGIQQSRIAITFSR